jgi:hypothetical protein
MSGFNSVDAFYDVMAGFHGLHESEPDGGALELYSYNGAEFPDGLDGCSLDVITAPSPEFLAYMRGNDSPVPPSGYKDMADEIKGIWDVYSHGSAEADWGRLAELYDDNNLSLSVIVDYEFMDWPETFGDILDGKGSNCWNLDGMVWHLYSHEACTVADSEGAWPSLDDLLECMSSDDVETCAYAQQFVECMDAGDYVAACRALKALDFELWYSQLSLTLCY